MLFTISSNLLFPFSYVTLYRRIIRLNILLKIFIIISKFVYLLLYVFYVCKQRERIIFVKTAFQGITEFSRCRVDKWMICFYGAQNETYIED